MSIQQTLNKIADLKSKIEKHCMCANFTDAADHFLVIFPLGFQVGGVRISKGLGIVAALEKALEKCEFYWKADQL